MHFSNQSYSKTFLLTCIICLSLVSNAQRFEKNKNSIKFHKTQLENLSITPENIQYYLLSDFKLTKEHRFVSTQELSDTLGMIHIRYNHLFQEHRVLGSNIVAHFRNGNLHSINGILRLPELANIPLIEKETAFTTAKIASEAKTFKWEFPEEEDMLKRWKEDSTATYYPTGELVYVPNNLDFQNPLTLCFAFEINSEEPLTRKNIFINAQTGDFWAEENLIHDTDVKGSANTKYRGVKTITTDSVSPNSFRLREVGRGGGIETYDMNQGTNYGSAVDFVDSDNYWNNYNVLFDEIAGDAHFGAEMTYDYFKEYFNRNSFDNNGAKIRSFVHYRKNYANAFWNGVVMTYGDGNGTSVTPLTSVDICGHEISHAVTTNSAGLIYRFESGALNESFSDIFGNAIEYYADSTQFSWRMGEDIMSSGNGIRNMANPKTHRDPGTYKGQYWYSGTGDNGGVHTNSGVQNFWFYLLTNGATGKNDNGDTYAVDSLGIRKAQQIAYRNLTVYLTTSSDYEEARYYAIQSAADLFGDCSLEVEATTNAWYAVGVGDAYDSSLVLAKFEADTSYCSEVEMVEFKNKSTNAISFVWDFGDGDTSHQRNPSHQYSNQGAYTISLIAESCYNNQYDTALIKDYIVIDSNQDICNGYLLPKGTWSTIHACNGFIYDHNGEGNYQGLLRDTITIDFGTSDSAHLTFSELDYEDKYDSIYVYDGFNTNGVLLGGFTGQKIPFNGQTQTLYNGAVTITHFSDPYVVGTGFKAKFETFKDSLILIKPKDRTVCHNQNVILTALGSGGDTSDYAYFWNGVKGKNSIEFVATVDTTIYITFGDECMKEYIYDSVVIKVRQPITFTQSKDTTICEGTTATLQLNPSGGTSDYLFRVSSGLLTQSSSLLFETPNLTPGKHDYWIQFTDGCTTPDDTAFYSITVGDSLQLQVSNDTTICYGTSIVLNGYATGGLTGKQYLYDWGKGPTSLSSKVASALKDTIYSVQLSDDCSAYQPQATINLQVLDSLNVTIIAQDTACYGEEILLNSTVTGGKTGDYKYSWTPSLETTSQYKTVMRSSEIVELTVSDGCTPKNGISSKNIITRAPLKVEVTPDTALCKGGTATIEAIVNGGRASTRQIIWDNDLGTAFKHSFVADSTKTYSVELSDGCSDMVTAEVTVTVYDLPEVSFNIDKNPTCTTLPVAFTDLSISNEPSTYLWNFGDGNTSAVTNPTHRYQKAGSYALSLTITDMNDCVDSVTFDKKLEIKEHPEANFSFSPQDPDFANALVTFTNESKFFTKSDWDFMQGYSDERDPTFEFLDTGSFKVTLTVANDIGCKSITTKSVFIKEVVLVFVPNAMSPNGDLVNDTFEPYMRGLIDPEVYIYNRNGHILWESTPNNYRWDGMVKNKRVPMGLYPYLISGKDINGQDFLRHGFIQVIY